ncbi:MAG: hypothetical protein EXR72_24230 [Myxococcales bacterium]|nr:hypothetical protein [Myxococcales bacterium]
MPTTRSLLLALLATGCSRPQPTPPDLARLPDLARVAVAAPEPPRLAEVELVGQLELPKQARGEPHVYITDGPCWQPSTRAFSETLAGATGFFNEVFVPQGTKLWVCAAMLPKSGPIVHHGALEKAPLAASGTGEVLYNDLRIKLTKGAPVTLPARRDGTVLP